MKKTLLLLSLCLLATGCNKNKLNTNNYQYGVFLGAEDSKSTLEKLVKYKEIAIEIDSFSSESIKYLKDNGVFIYSYLSVGSLEKYKPYYDEFKNLTFMDYDNWPDERWIDVSNSKYQDKLIELATSYKNKGSEGLFLDNYDVYYIALEEYKVQDLSSQIYQGLVTITDRLKSLNQKLMLNSGIDFLEKCHDDNLQTFKKISALNQENVFASIIDYDHDKFGSQSKEDHEYYMEAVETMNKYGLEIYLLEYTKDNSLIKKIDEYCINHQFKYYISNKVNLE